MGGQNSGEDKKHPDNEVVAFFRSRAIFFQPDNEPRSLKLVWLGNLTTKAQILSLKAHLKVKKWFWLDKNVSRSESLSIFYQAVQSLNHQVKTLPKNESNVSVAWTYCDFIASIVQHDLDKVT